MDEAHASKLGEGDPETGGQSTRGDKTEQKLSADEPTYMSGGRASQAPGHEKEATGVRSSEAVTGAGHGRTTPAPRTMQA